MTRGPAPRPQDEKTRPGSTSTATKAVLDVEVLPALVDPDQPPAVPDGLDYELADDWTEFWRSPLARGVATTDMPALRRLYRLRSLQVELFQTAELNNFVSIGSTGQEVAHPAMKAANDLEPKITALEDRFGLSPKARQNMGIRMGQLADAAAKVAKAAQAAQETTPRADPRLTDTGSAAT